jgi:hypothetical protein
MARKPEPEPEYANPDAERRYLRDRVEGLTHRLRDAEDQNVRLTAALARKEATEAKTPVPAIVKARKSKLRL